MYIYDSNTIASRERVGDRLKKTHARKAERKKIGIKRKETRMNEAKRENTKRKLISIRSLRYT